MNDKDKVCGNVEMELKEVKKLGISDGMDEENMTASTGSWLTILCC